MSYFETYRSRLLSQGHSSAESVINTTKQVVNNSFDTSLSTKTVLIDGVSIITIVNQGKNSEEKSILFKPDTVIDKGAVVTIDSLNYLVMDFEANEVYPVAKVRLCNSTFPIQSDKTRVLIGTDSDGRPVYDYTSTSVSVPCIVENKINSDLDNSTLPLPDGRINITMKYQIAENLTVNSEFEMYGSTYKILDFDYTKVIGDKGIMVIHAERTVK